MDAIPRAIPGVQTILQVRLVQFQKVFRLKGESHQKGEKTLFLKARGLTPRALRTVSPTVTSLQTRPSR